MGNVPTVRFMEKPIKAKQVWKFAFKDENQYNFWLAELGTNAPKHVKLVDVTTGAVYVRY